MFPLVELKTEDRNASPQLLQASIKVSNSNSLQCPSLPLQFSETVVPGTIILIYLNIEGSHIDVDKSMLAQHAQSLHIKETPMKRVQRKQKQQTCERRE